MYESALAIQDYGDLGRSTATPRGVEYEVFARVTRDLTSAEGAGPFAAMAKALTANLDLWTVLGVDVAGDGNTLPAELRSKIFYLFEFTRHHTARVMKGEATAGVLIDINKAVMRGLRGSKEREVE
ncbi:MAG: flagellar biosynthesis regulator FlaF [Amphiplicatus sp.]